MKKITQLLIAATFGLSTATANASTIFSATDGDVNFILGDLNSYMLAIFDDDDAAYTGTIASGTALEVFNSSIVSIAGPNGLGDHIATNELGMTLALSGSDNFRLGISLDDITWLSDTAATFLGGNSYLVEFLDGEASIFSIDLTVVPQTLPQVPVPAAVWLFGSGLLGLVAIARRRA